jgi:hypothetical protein
MDFTSTVNLTKRDLIEDQNLLPGRAEAGGQDSRRMA